MGIKISELPNNTLPYSGGEEFPLVQAGETRAGTLSSLVNYLSGALTADSELSALSGTWQNTYTTVNSNSGNWNNTYTTVNSNSGNWNNTYTSYSGASSNYAVKNANNNFTAGQTIAGKLTAEEVSINSLYNIIGNGTSIAISDVDLVGAGSNVVDISVRGGYNPGWGHAAQSNNVLIGSNINPINPPVNSILIGANAGESSHECYSHNIMIGYNAGAFCGHGTAGFSNNFNIMIGSYAGYNSAPPGFEASSSIFIGRYAGENSYGSKNILIGNDTEVTANHCIIIGDSSASAFNNCLVLGVGITTDEVGKIYIGSVSHPYHSHVSTNGLSTYGSGGFTKLKVKVNGNDYYIPLLPS